MYLILTTLMETLSSCLVLFGYAPLGRMTHWGEGPTGEDAPLLRPAGSAAGIPWVLWPQGPHFLLISYLVLGVAVLDDIECPKLL